MSGLGEMREKIADIIAAGEGRLSTEVADQILSLQTKSGYSLQQLIEVAERVDENSRLAVVEKGWPEIPDPDPHSYEGEFEAMCAVKEMAEKSGFVKEIKG